MTAGSVLAGAPSSVTKVHAVAPSVYREVVIMWYDYHSGSYQGSFERLEPDDVKVSSPVPRGLGGSNAPWLPERTRSLSEQRKTTMRLLSPNTLRRPTVILPRPKLPT